MPSSDTDTGDDNHTSELDNEATTGMARGAQVIVDPHDETAHAPSPGRGGGTQDAALRPGVVLDGRYQIERLIAAGAMSRVFLARQLQIHRPVAIKVISRELARERETMVRFRREARALAEVQHPGIVNVYDVGTTALGEPYIVMEYVAGKSLSAELKAGGRLPPAEAAGVILQAAEALAVVHHIGVVHRDLKPGNLLLGKAPGGRLQLKLVDFGLAKALQDRDEEFLTKIGTVVGTPEYMAPEQIRGGDIDGRADVYSLGALFYEMLTGKPPFTGAEMSTLYCQLHEPIKPLAEAGAAGVPEPIERLILRMLAKERDQRPTVDELRTELVAAVAAAGLHIPEQLGGAARATAGAAAVEPPPPRPRLLRSHVLLLALVLVLASLAGGVAIERFRRPPGADAPAVVDAAGAASVLAAVPADARLVVFGEPGDATVRLDGGEPAPTPATLDPAPGEHRLVIERNGFRPDERTVTVDADRTTVVRFQLARPSYEVAVATSPPGAMVSIDGKPVGPSPVTATLTEGEFHDITATLDGYQPLSHYVLADQPEPKLSFRMRPALLRYGSLYIETDGYQRIFIDGQDTGLRTPTADLQLAPGRHEVTLVSGEGTRLSRTVTIRHNEPTVVDFR